MRRLKPKQRTARCKYCKRQGVSRPSMWRDGYDTACDEHRADLERDIRDDGHLTEADYQTWMRR